MVLHVKLHQMQPTNRHIFVLLHMVAVLWRLANTPTHPPTPMKPPKSREPISFFTIDIPSRNHIHIFHRPCIFRVPSSIRSLPGRVPMSLHCTCRSPKESDCSRLENGRCGAEIAWQEPGGAWKTRGFPLGKGYEVFDAELLGVVQALQVAQKAGDQRPVTILLDSQAAIAGLQHTQSGPGQALATQAHTMAERLQAQDRQPTIQWVPGHAGVEGNERADQAANRPARQDQERSQWPLPAEPGRRPLQHRSRDGLPGSLASNPNRAEEPTGHRGTGDLTPQLQWLPNTWQAAIFN